MLHLLPRSPSSISDTAYHTQDARRINLKQCVRTLEFFFCVCVSGFSFLVFFFACFFLFWWVRQWPVSLFHHPVNLNCRICRQHICKGDTKLYRMVKRQSWSFEECRIPPSLLLLPGPLRPGMAVPVNVPSLNQIYPFNQFQIITIGIV